MNADALWISKLGISNFLRPSNFGLRILPCPRSQSLWIAVNRRQSLSRKCCSQLRAHCGHEV